MIKIDIETVELNICYHCNLRCAFCSHFSDRMKTYFVNPKQLGRDLSILAKFLSVDYVTLLGGEPLLHPKIMGIIKEVRNSNLSKKIRVVTNGLLLKQMPNEFWESIDECHISIYPNVKIKQTDVTLYKYKAKRFNTILEIKYFDNFRVSYSETGTNNKHLIQRIYSSCQIAHVWRCYTIDNGYFYKCPQSLFIPKIFKLSDSNLNNERVRIKKSDIFKIELIKFLQSTEPLVSCSRCLGSVGILFPHSTSIDTKVLEYKKQPTEELVDWNFLRKLEIDPQADNGCVSCGGD